MLHAGILMSVILPSMVIVGQIGLLITELMEERMHARELVVVKGNGRAGARCMGGRSQIESRA